MDWLDVLTKQELLRLIREIEPRIRINVNRPKAFYLKLIKEYFDPIEVERKKPRRALNLQSASEEMIQHLVRSTEDEIGTGVTSLVRRVTYDSKEYALKTIVKGEVSPVEMFLLSSVRHPNLICSAKVFVHNDQINYLLPLGKTSLDKYIYKMNSFSFDKKVKFLYEITNGLAFLNETMKFVHGDLKLENILIMENNQLKIADYGICKFIYSNGYQEIISNYKSNWFLSTEIITPSYKSPLVRLGKKKKVYVTDKSDIWSLGIVAFEIFFGIRFSSLLNKYFYRSTEFQKLSQVIKEDHDAPPNIYDYIEELLDIRYPDQIENEKLRQFFEKVFVYTGSIFEDEIQRPKASEILNFTLFENIQKENKGYFIEPNVELEVYQQTEDAMNFKLRGALNRNLLFLQEKNISLYTNDLVKREILRDFILRIYYNDIIPMEKCKLIIDHLPILSTIINNFTPEELDSIKSTNDLKELYSNKYIEHVYQYDSNYSCDAN